MQCELSICKVCVRTHRVIHIRWHKPARTYARACTYGGISLHIRTYKSTRIYVIFYFFLAATANNTPSTMPNMAANSTLIFGGSRKVMVCAGYQNKGMVFLNTNPHNTAQFSSVIIRFMGMGVSSAFTEPPQWPMWVSVILWRVIKTGAKMLFMATDMALSLIHISEPTRP